MMLCNDQQLRVLLSYDEHSREYLQVATHVEQCERCQSRLATLAQEDTEWWDEAKSSWTDEPLPRSNDGCRTHSVIVELDREGLGDCSIDYEPIHLDFLEPASHPELLGRLGRYEIERVVGQGGMGIVLKGFDTELHRVVAIKVLAPHLAHRASARRRFSREAQAAAAVVHSHVIPIFNVESESNLPYLVMQFVAGPSLQARVDERGPLSVDETLRIAQQTAAGLAAAHGQGLVHRDVKPANILLEDQVDRVLLSDFGLARTVDDASLTRTGIITGTPFYMSPEQANGAAIDARSDLFSLGSVIYFMLTGHSPFRSRGAMAVLNRICVDTHRPIQEINPLVPYEVCELVDRLLAKSPDDRYANAHIVEEELNRLLSLLRSGGLQLNKRPSRRLVLSLWLQRKAVIAAGLLLAVSISGVFAVPALRTYWNTAGHLPSAPSNALSLAEFREMQSADRDSAKAAEQWTNDVRLLDQKVRALMQNQTFPAPFTDAFYDRVNEIQFALRKLDPDGNSGGNTASPISPFMRP